MGQGLRTGLGNGGITCVLQTHFFFFFFVGGGGVRDSLLASREIILCK